jgi:two-component system NtrC family response regulator
MRVGAFTYLLKPIARDALKAAVDQALRTRALQKDNDRLRTLLELKAPDTGLVYRSAVMEEFADQLRRAAPTDATVLITGESGTGKELAARACHDLSPRWDQAFVAVNCGAIPRELMESELFGHRRGAFTGADRDFQGRIRLADGGTLFLDEIGELPLELQAKLLRVLETRQVDPVGSDRPVAVDFRLVCAANRDLPAEVAAGRFREDLLFRINVLQLTLPPLRDRAGDVALLWEHFTRLHAGEDLVSEPSLMAALEARPWRGNVRELKNLNQRLVLMRSGEALSAADLVRLAPEAAPPAPPPGEPVSAEPAGLPLGPLPPEGLSLIELEKEVIRRALAHCGGNRTRAAAYLDVPRHVLVYRIDKYGLA